MALSDELDMGEDGYSANNIFKGKTTKTAIYQH